MIRQGYSLPFVRPPPYVFVSCGDSVAEAAVQTSFVPNNQSCRGDCQSVAGSGGILFPLLPGYQAHWWVLPHPQPTWTQLIIRVVKFHMETLTSILQGLHKGWWMVSLDFKDANLHVLIHPSH